ncbi:MAG: hypothetical protein ABSG98_00395 [Anaerolineales bacterium]|jgi:hypothetical protein
MELTFSKRALFAGLAGLFILAGAAILIRRIQTGPSRLDRTAPHPSPTAVPSPHSPDLLTDDAAGEVVRETVVAYFSIDPEDEAAWAQAMTKVAADPETVEILESSLWPEMSKSRVRSSPSQVAVRRVLTGYDTLARRSWQVWGAQVSGLSSWPAPAPEPIGPFAIPWSRGGEVSLYVTVFKQEGQWRFGLFPVDDLVKEQLEPSAAKGPQDQAEP